MKTIKFRAWDSYQNKMYEWDEICKMDSDESLTLTNLLNGFIDHIKPLQFTGLKDKNGVEVFENDIVEMRSEYGNSDDDYRDFDLTYTGRIVVLPSLGVCIRNPKIFNHITGETSTYSGYKTIAAYRSVKIGNIYENPELL